MGISFSWGSILNSWPRSNLCDHQQKHGLCLGNMKEATYWQWLPKGGQHSLLGGLWYLAALGVLQGVGLWIVGHWRLWLHDWLLLLQGMWWRLAGRLKVTKQQLQLLLDCLLSCIHLLHLLL